MPRLDDRGNVTPKIGYHWYDHARFLFQDCTTPCPTPDTCASSNGCHVRLTDRTIIAHHAIVALVANGRRTWAYVEFVRGQDPTQARYHDSFGRERINAYPHAISPEGDICVKPHSNVGATVLKVGGPDVPLSAGDAQDIQLLSGGRAKWTEAGVVHANFPLIGNPGRPVTSPRVADDGTLLYQDVFANVGTGALVLAGKVIAPPSAHYFYPDVRLIDGVYVVTWSPNQADTDAQFIRLTSAQLAALPDVGSVQPPTPNPQPPMPKPEPEPMPVPNYLHVVEAVRAKYDTPLGDRHWQFLVELAQSMPEECMLFRDDADILIPALRVKVAADIIEFPKRRVWVDVLLHSEADAKPVWQVHENAEFPERFVDVSQVELPGESPVPVPVPVPAPVPEPAPPASDLAAQVRALRADVDRLKAHLRAV